MKLISDAVSLWDEICKRGLEPGKEGRDDALLNSIARRLDLRGGEIRQQLRKKRVKVEQLVYAFFSVIEPFAKMYAEIYAIMQRFGAKRAKENMLVKFDFSFPEGKLEFDISKFKERYEVIWRARGLQRVWTPEDLRKLFRLFEILRSDLTDARYARGVPYQRGNNFELPTVPPFSGDLYGVLVKVRTAVEWAIESVDSEPNINHNHPLWRYYSLLTDVVPALQSIILQGAERLGRIEKRTVNEAKDYFTNEIWDKLRVRKTKELIKELIDVLNLPFWKYRWYLYEVWATMHTADALAEFDVVFDIDSTGTLNVDRSKMTVVATAKTDQGLLNVVAQLQTPLDGMKGRTAVQPDLRICEDPIDVPTSTLLVVELKQRKKMTREYMAEIVASYEMGCPNSAKNFFLSYDTLLPRFQSVATARSSLIGDFNPSQPGLVRAYKDEIAVQLINTGYKPAKQFDAILFDVSGSMRGKYESDRIQEAIRTLLIKNRRSRVFVFNYQLFEREVKDPFVFVESLKDVEGDTKLEPCLKILLGLGVKRILVITDGEYGEVESMPKFEVTQCQPTYREIMDSVDQHETS